MFEKETVFILGAGSSWHYNYPTGESLVKRVIQKAEEIKSAFEHEKNRSEFTNSANMPSFFMSDNNRSFSNEQIEILTDFINRFNHVDPPVIDYFLSWNPTLAPLAKMLIAWVIIECEKQYNEIKGNYNRQLLAYESPYRSERVDVDFSKYKDNWYRFLLYKFLSQCQNFEDICENKVKFITFNYDVSLENYFFKGLNQIDFLKDCLPEVSDYLNGLFIHVYGRVRSECFSDLKYPKVLGGLKPLHNLKQVLDMAWISSKLIRTIGSDKDDLETQERIRGQIKKAEDVYILGYGFDEMNSQRIGLNNYLALSGLSKGSNEKPKSRKVYFTNMGDRNSINKKASKIFFGKESSYFVKNSVFEMDEAYQWNSKTNPYYEKSTKDVYSAIDEDFGGFV